VCDKKTNNKEKVENKKLGVQSLFHVLETNLVEKVEFIIYIYQIYSLIKISHVKLGR
jgi:hypothetical protein